MGNLPLSRHQRLSFEFVSGYPQLPIPPVTPVRTHSIVAMTEKLLPLIHFPPVERPLVLSIPPFVVHATDAIASNYCDYCSAADLPAQRLVRPTHN